MEIVATAAEHHVYPRPYHREYANRESQAEDSDGFGDFEKVDFEHKVTDSESSDEDSSDDSDEDGALAADEMLDAGEQVSADKKLVVRGIDDGSQAEFPDHGIVLNLITNVAHRARPDGKSCSCGAKLSDLNSEFHYLQSDLMGRSLCWRSGCAPWHASSSNAHNE
jgi:hypothetical protein